MTESSNSEKNILNIRSSLSNEHLLFADTLRDWSDPLLHGQEPIHTPLCPRCATCKCESLKNLPNPKFNSHHPSCPNYRHSYSNKHVKRRAASHDPKISTFAINQSSNKTSCLSSPTNEIYETDSLNEDSRISDDEKQEIKDRLNLMDEQISIKKKKRIEHRSSSDRQQRQRRRRRRQQQPPTRGRSTTSNDLSLSSSSSSSNSLSVESKQQKRSRQQQNSSLSDDSLSEKKSIRTSRARSNSSIYLIQVPNENSFGLTKSQIYLWKSTNSNDDNEVNVSNYSIEQVQPNSNCSKRSMGIASRNVNLQRGQIDYWQNCALSTDTIITSSCQNSTGSASHLLSQTTDNSFERTPTSSIGHIISITTTKRQQPSLLNQTKNIQWNIEHDGKQFRYSKIDEQLHPMPTTQSTVDNSVKQVAYASTDEDVDEFNSNQSETIDRTNVRSQITMDSGIEIFNEQKVYQLSNENQTINEQSSEDTATDQNDLFALSDDSLIESSNKHSLLNSFELSPTFMPTQNQISIEKDLYSGYELETITDEEDDEQKASNSTSNELILTSESRSTTVTPSTTTTVPPRNSTLPPQFEFKLPTFGEWIDRVFTSFLTETNEDPSQSIGSSRSSSIMSIPNSQSTINTSSSSQVITVVENENFKSNSFDQSPVKDVDEHSLNDMSSSSLNSDEKVDFDTYIINSNYEKINPSLITNEQNEILFINERSKSLLSSITSSIENDDQEPMNNNDRDLISTDVQLTTNLSHNDLTSINRHLSTTFYSKDSALGLSDEHIHQNVNNDSIKPNETIGQTMNQLDRNNQRTISSTSLEQLIPKEKQTGMYYKAFGSSAALHLAEEYNSEWLQTSNPNETEENHVRIVHQCDNLGDNEDEFYFSPQIFHPSYSCPNLYSNPTESILNPCSYSLTTLDNYAHLNITHETLEQIWLSLLDIAYSDRDDYELGEYKLRHIIGLSNSYSNINQNLIEKSRSHNDIFSLKSKPNNPQKTNITKLKSKSFDITSLIKHSNPDHESANIGLLQGADISEPFADRLISTSVQSDLESIPSLEIEQILNENFPVEAIVPASSPTPTLSLSPSPSPPLLPTITKEPLEFVFNYSPQIISTDDLFDLESEDKPLSISVTFDTDDLPPPMIPIKDTYTELSLFRPHSLSTIPSSRASQYASSVDSDDQYEHEHQFTKENSDDDHGVLGSEFSSPQSRPLSSITSRPLSPEPNQSLPPSKFADIDHDAWERAINDECTQNLSSILPVENLEEKHSYIVDEIVPVVITNKKHDKTYIEEISIEPNLSSFQQDYLTHELSTATTTVESFVDPKELSERLEQLDHCSIKQEEKIIIHQPIPTRSFQRIEKVSDLEIVKSDKGFKIGYIDRQGTDQRIILTKRIEAGPDVLERDPHTRLPSKGRRILNPTYSSVLYTNGYNNFQEDTKFERTADEIEVLSIGTNPKHFDESDMVSIDIDGPSTMLSSICESIVITQGSVYSKPIPKSNEEDPLLHIQTTHSIKNDKIEIIDSWHDRTVIHGNGTPWRSPFKPPKSSTKQEKTTRDVALSPISLPNEFDLQQTVDRSCQYSPPTQQDQSLQCYFESLTTYDHPGYYKLSTDNPSLRTLMSLERSADSGILVDDNHRIKSHLALQVDLKSSSSDSEDLSEMNTTRPLNIYETPSTQTGEIEQEIVQLRRERAHILDLLSLNWNRSNIWVELTEAKLNFIIGETDALLRSLSFDPTPADNETIKLKMHQYEEDMAELTRQHLAVYRERLEDSKKQLDLKIIELESRKSRMGNPSIHSISQQYSRLLPNKRSQPFLSTSAENLTKSPLDESIDTHQDLLDISFLTTKASDTALHRPTARYTSKNLSKMEGLSQSQQAIIDETDKLIQDSQQLHTESASQFERARESLLSSETPIRLARANLAASRQSEKKPYLPKDVTLAELFKYEQSLAKETAKSYRHIYSTTEF